MVINFKKIDLKWLKMLHLANFKSNNMETFKIILFSVFAACVYGVAHDLVTAHVCIEYFTVGHPPVFPTTSPILLAMGWGIIATWWIGLLLGVPLAVVFRFGKREKSTCRQIVKPVLLLLLVLYVCSMVAGCIGYVCGRLGWTWLLPPLSEMIPVDRHAAFLFDLWAHSAAYLLGVPGGIVLMIITWRKRPYIVQPIPESLAVNLFADLPKSLSEELLQTLLATDQLRIERIVSTGHANPTDFWYDQPEHEWVVVLQGEATLEIINDHGETITQNMQPGDHVLLPARRKHRVASTAPDQPTVWLAIFFRQ